jgi:RimJ/RimL family protein N-acetyltransferase
MLAAEEDLANRVAELANKKGLTVYQTVNDILEQALRGEKAGVNLREALDRRDDMKRAREMGLTFTPEHLYYQVVDLIYGQQKDRVLDLWREMGLWYGKYFQGKGEPEKSLIDALAFMTHGGEFKLDKNKGEELIISCINDRYTQGYTEAFSGFMEMAFQVLGYKSLEREASRGIIKLRLTKR